MKDIVISGRRIVREALILAAGFVVALGINVYAILRFGTEWKELFTTLPITTVIALLLFAFLAVLRMLVFGCRRLFRRKIVYERQMSSSPDK